MDALETLRDRMTRRHLLRASGATTTGFLGAPVVGSVPGALDGGSPGLPHGTGRLDASVVQESRRFDEDAVVSAVVDGLADSLAGVVDSDEEALGSALRPLVEGAFDRFAPPFVHTNRVSADQRYRISASSIAFQRPDGDCGRLPSAPGLYFTVLKISIQNLMEAAGEGDQGRAWERQSGMAAWMGLGLEGCLYAGQATSIDAPLVPAPDLPYVRGIDDLTAGACSAFCPDKRVDPVAAPAETVSAILVEILEEVVKEIVDVIIDILVRVLVGLAVIVVAIAVLFVAFYAVSTLLTAGLAAASAISLPAIVAGGSGAAAAGAFLVGAFAIAQQFARSSGTGPNGANGLDGAPDMGDVHDVAADDRLSDSF